MMIVIAILLIIISIIDSDDHKWHQHVLVHDPEKTYALKRLIYTGTVNLFSAAWAASCLLKSSTQGLEQQRRSKTSSDLIPKRLFAHRAQTPADACTVDSSWQKMKIWRSTNIRVYCEKRREENMMLGLMMPKVRTQPTLLLLASSEAKAFCSHRVTAARFISSASFSSFSLFFIFERFFFSFSLSRWAFSMSSL